ncbi:MAG: carboxypeptidase-like regulatory domain-containing protein, partial [Tumebacillaceae bacterium]
MAALAVLLYFGTTSVLFAQSLTQGAVRGSVLDPSGAAIPNATVTLHNDDTGQTLTSTTSSTGGYNFALLPPGHYTLSVAAPNYQNASRKVVATLGQVTSADVKLALATQNQTVTVTAEGGVLQTVTPEPSTIMSTEQIQLVPNGGGDLSYVAQTAPGSQMNTQGGYGNFASNGLPAITNNFTVNSMPENDPFLNLNNSGATNILLGQNDVSEATVVTNGYEGQYMQAGANVNYLSRSGTNSYHGNAIWRWNGRNVNANNYFNKQNTPPTPRGFVNDNMWAASFGGPIRKDKTFFFANTEGLYLIVPVASNVKVPSPQFQSAVLSNIAAVQPAELPLYQSMFNIYNNAPGAAHAADTINGGGCGSFAVAGFGPGGAPCALQYNSTVNASTHEWLITGRLDQNIG